MEARAAPGSPPSRPTVKMRSCSTSGQCQHVVGNTGYKYFTVSDESESAALCVCVCVLFVCGRTMEPQCFDQTLAARAKCATPPALVNGYILVRKGAEQNKMPCAVDLFKLRSPLFAGPAGYLPGG